MNATKVHGVQSVSLLLAFVESVWVVLSAPPKMLLLCLKGIIGQKVTLFKKVQLVVMFLGAASILLLQVSCNKSNNYATRGTSLFSFHDLISRFIHAS